jgi:hypothetical protein
MSWSVSRNKNSPPGTVLKMASRNYDGRGVSEGVGEDMLPIAAVDGEIEASGLLTGVSEGPEDTAGASVGAAEALGSIAVEGWAARYCSCNTTVSSISAPEASIFLLMTVLSAACLIELVRA